MSSKICFLISLLFLLSTDVYILSMDDCSVDMGNPWEGVENNRIPNDTTVNHYDLYLNPDLSTKQFSGHVTIHITTTENKNYFIVNIKELTITNYNMSKVENPTHKTEVSITTACEYKPNEFFVIQTRSHEAAGDYELYFEFNGTLADKIIGFYYSTYENEDEEDIALATAKFEPTYARQAFPCFDEPSFRSTYSITIVRPIGNGYIGLSNMPIESETINSPSDGQTEVKFETSVSMVTYLVCFIVSDFVYKESILQAANGSLPFRVYSPSGRIDNMQYALDFGGSTLLFYEQMFDYPFPLPKSDMAAIPDYSSGATEHWGIITYRETNILYNNETSSKSNYQRVSSVIAHELAHQWFGNLVTLEWWNDLWLNEGFASYIEYIGVDNYHPDWDMNAQFIIDNLQYVFDLDSKLSSHPIVQEVSTADEINAMFDTISYSKGSSVIRMCEGFMGPANFQDGINNFIKKYAFQNAVTQNLWDELQSAWSNTGNAAKDITEIMDTWTKQMGYPLITAQQVPGFPSQIRFFQNRFLKDPAAESNDADSPYGYNWNVPLSVLTPSGNVVNGWFYTEDDDSILDLGEDVEWFKVNYRQKGYYRVNYVDAVTWSKMGELCSNLTLGTEDRSSLYDDVFALADSGFLGYAIPLSFSEALVNEVDYVPWFSASKIFEKNLYLLLTTDVLVSFKNYTQNLVTSIYNELQWEDGGNHLQTLLRYVIVDLSCMADLPSCLESSGNLLQSWIDDVNFQLPIDTRRRLYWWGQIKSGSQDNWNIMWERCLEELDPTARSNLYYGLSNSQDTAILSNYITMAQDEGNVKSQDFLSILEYIALNPAGMDLVWDWVRTNWDWLVGRYTLNDRYLGQLIPEITQYFATNEKLAEMELFFQENPDAGAGAQNREQALETVQYNIYWVATNSPVIADWLLNNT